MVVKEKKVSSESFFQLFLNLAESAHAEPLGYSQLSLEDFVQIESHLWQLLCNVSANEYGLQVDPEVLHHQPVLKNLCRIGQVFHPLLNVWLERSIVPAEKDAQI